VKWFLIGSACLLYSMTWVRGDATQTTQDLFKQAVALAQSGKYEDAGYLFDKVIAASADSPYIDEVRIRAGDAYMHAGMFSEAIDRLSKATDPKAKPEYRAMALYCTALAQFSKGQKNHSTDSYRDAAGTFSTLIDMIKRAPTADNTGYLEEAINYRSLAKYFLKDYQGTENDLIELCQSFSGSLNRPDYLVRLGSIYAMLANQAMTDKKPADEVRAQAKKAMDVFDQVIMDPNALVQGNEAKGNKAEILFMLAGLDPSSPAGYEKTLEAFRQVKRKADMIQTQENRLNDLRKQAFGSSDMSQLIEREENRLAELTKSPDPIIDALIRMAECYVCMRQPDEARTILHRISAHATLTPDEQKEVDFQTLYSYVLGGQTDQADAALDKYLSKHAGDKIADSISYQIAAALLGRKDYAGALHQAQRSLHDFPNGKYATDVLTLEAQAYTGLGQTDKSNEIIKGFLQDHQAGPQAASVRLTRGRNETNEGDLNGALKDYDQVKNDSSAGPALQGSAYVQYIETLNSLHRYEDVISETRIFASQYGNRSDLPNITKVVPDMLLLSALAMDQKDDHKGAVAALQDIARNYPKDDASPRALYDVVTIYHGMNDTAAMAKAATDLRDAYPDAYAFLAQAADMVSDVLVKEGKFDAAIALYQPLANSPKPEVAAAAHNKIAGIGLAAAAAPGSGPEADKQLSAAEQAYVGTLKNFPDQLDAVGEALEGLVKTGTARHLKDSELEGYLMKVGAPLTSPDMEARLELAKAGLVFVMKDGSREYPAALERFKKVIEANPDLRLTRQETDQYGELLLAAKDYAGASKVYGDLLANADPTDQVTQGYAYYGLGAAYLAQGDLANAKSNFLKLKATPGGGQWHPHILDANFGIALADERSGRPADMAQARQIYSDLMQNLQSSQALLAKAMLGYGRLLEKSGHALKPTAADPKEYAIHYYREPHLLFRGAVAEESAEGLYDAGQAYERLADRPSAKKQYEELRKNYGSTAPDWAAKAKAAEDQLGL
jgi:tetratricopeptide (TPR) repeat protein